MNLNRKSQKLNLEKNKQQFWGVCETDKNTEENPLKQKKQNPQSQADGKRALASSHVSAHELKQQTAEMQTQQGSNWGEYSEKS